MSNVIKGRNKWWDHYRGEEVVIIEELSPKFEMLAEFLKDWADHYAFIGESKGGSKWLRPKKIIVCSNYPIEACFKEVQDHEPLLRRFKVVYFDGEIVSYTSMIKVTEDAASQVSNV